MPISQSRRTFLQTLSLGVSATLTPAYMLANEKVSFQKNEKRLGVALVGLGSYAKNQLAVGLAQADNCYLAGIVTGTPSKAEEWSKKYNIPQKNIYNYQNFDQIANNKDIDIVYVVLPNSMHHEFVIRAARAGDEAKFEKLVDFPSLRESLKAELNAALMARMSRDPRVTEFLESLGFPAPPRRSP